MCQIHSSPAEILVLCRPNSAPPPTKQAELVSSSTGPLQTPPEAFSAPQTPLRDPELPSGMAAWSRYGGGALGYCGRATLQPLRGLRGCRGLTPAAN